MRKKYKLSNPYPMPPARKIAGSTRLREEVFRAAPGLEAAEALFDAVGDVLFCVKDRGGVTSRRTRPSCAVPGCATVPN